MSVEKPINEINFLVSDVIERYKFKDYDSMIEYCIAALKLNEDHYLTIKTDGELTKVIPGKDLLKDG